MSERYDIAIVGSGPAGITAAINAKIRNKRIIIFGYENLSNKLYLAPKINNYVGFPGISGKDLTEKFKDHLKEMDIEITYERVDSIYAMGDYYALMVNDKTYEATGIVLATGVSFGKPFKGESEFLGRGVGYCATCDAPLYKNKVVTIIGYNKESIEEANYVSELAAKVYYIPMFKGDVDLNSNIEVINDKPVEIIGDSHVNKLVLKNSEVETDGLFILRDNISPDQLVPGLLVEEGHIKVSRDMETNLKGCYAAGDAVGKPYQYLKSMGEGQVAALNAVSYLDKLSREK
ncbi:NAD(P)/FAD-dependent oxidoreductase [Clostridium swellfunianum]|uniref:NAD(P)/FAD-dependent oxidoreductase n=1 Tax=Clostridium swellfunianum TaxID=1367462 RepID=UPI00202DFDF6|nr:NAD(P)/FAD-dependent oxidoreductase [Clostridium swellfunianum]MCM0650685.1 NAD(P)/FAD-dependent oxidoreductase [Clostridium swellfunianum]